MASVEGFICTNSLGENRSELKMTGSTEKSVDALGEAAGWRHSECCVLIRARWLFSQECHVYNTA